MLQENESILEREKSKLKKKKHKHNDEKKMCDDKYTKKQKIAEISATAEKNTVETI